MKTDPSYLGKYAHHYFKIKSLSTIVMKNTFPLFAVINSFLLPCNVQTYITASWLRAESVWRQTLDYLAVTSLQEWLTPSINFVSQLKIVNMTTISHYPLFVVEI